MTGLVPWNLRSVSEHRDLLVRVIVLKNVSDGLNCPQILILIVLVVIIVERARILWVSIGSCKVDSYVEADFAAAKDILKE